MKKTIFVYIVFAFLLTSFAGCGKLKNIVGLKDLTEEQLLERELKSFNLKDMVIPKFSADGLRAVVEYRDKLFNRLLDIKDPYYEQYVYERSHPKIVKPAFSVEPS
jgi:hypothetical protein